MGYQLLYGNPWSATMAGAVVAKGGTRGAYARSIARHKLALEERALELQEAERISRERMANAALAQRARESSDAQSAQRRQEREQKRANEAQAEQAGQAQAQQAEQAQAQAQQAEARTLSEFGATVVPEEANRKGKIDLSDGATLHRGQDGKLWRIPKAGREAAAAQAKEMQADLDKRRAEMEKIRDQKNAIKVFAPNAREMERGVEMKALPEGMTAIWGLDGRQIVGPPEELKRIVEVSMRQQFGADAAPFALAEPARLQLDADRKELDSLRRSSVAQPDKFEDAAGASRVAALERRERETILSGVQDREHRELARAAYGMADGLPETEMATGAARVGELVADLASPTTATRRAAADELRNFRWELRERELTREGLLPETAALTARAESLLDGSPHAERVRPALQQAASLARMNNPSQRIMAETLLRRAIEDLQKPAGKTKGK